MRAHPKPDFDFNFNLHDEIKELNAHRKKREIPAIANKKLLIATWNLTNFGLQERTDDHLALMAHIIGYFDIIAVQEVADDLTQFLKILDHLGPEYAALLTDIAGNDERLGYIYNRKKAKPTGMIAELAMRGYERRRIVIKVRDQEEEEVFDGFNRNPYMATFQVGTFEFTLVNVHLYWSNFSIRQLETIALSKWAKSRVDNAFPPNNDIILLGDFNMADLNPEDKIYAPLVENGLYVPKFDTELIGSNLAGDAHYDEMAFFPSRTGADFTNKIGVFDFDKVLFKELWDENDKAQKQRFFQYIRYYMADHRPLWCQFHYT
ncbi:MAG: endonuclease/exonuclease/phosphatase family protein [Saprospiraceae bacterium]|nr:endonuclease/exonuclease/phosphatase family protein [Saprospiraceae bacterium]